MLTRKETLIFLAGAAAAHTLTHLVLRFADVLPLTVFGHEITQTNNMYCIAISAIIAVGLLYYAKGLKK